MKITNDHLTGLLQEFVQGYTDHYQNTYGHLPTVEVDDDWPSPCIQGSFDQQKNCWQPVPVQENLSFDNIESALELTIHQDIKHYFSSLYSDTIHAKCAEGNLSLLFPWSRDDFERLQENIIGHVLMKRKLKQAVTIFFAVTDEEDMILSVLNDSGEVWVERVGCEPHKKLANSLADFIQMLTPVVPLNEK